MQHRKEGKRKTIIIVAEGAHDCQLNPITSEEIKNILTDRLGLDTRVTTLGHTQRGGRPAAYDRILVGSLTSFRSSTLISAFNGVQATLQGAEAVDAVLNATPDSPSPVIGIEENKITRKPLMAAVKRVSLFPCHHIIVQC